MIEMKACIVEKDGAYSYYDKDGNELHDGDTIIWTDGRVQKLYATEDGFLGTDATNPSWVASGRAVECEFGVYPLEWQEMAAYTVRGAFAGELQATKELLAYEHNIPVSDITAKVEWR